MNEFKKFKSLFNFQKNNTGKIGVEREAFLCDLKGNIKPMAFQVLEHLNNTVTFTYELSACQLEDRIGPCYVDELLNELNKNNIVIQQAEKELGFTRIFYEVGPDNMPLDIYPDPTGRYQEIVRRLTTTELLAACRVIGLHIHVGMRDFEEALKIYNKVIKSTKELCMLGDNSNGRRLAIYKKMTPDFTPPYYDSIKSFYAYAKMNGFDKDPRQCWHLIRISKHGTIEFRMFGATANNNKIVQLAKKCHELCFN